ncbi:hypothetical protein L3Y34_014490 [Caenorhabditis briggsae]|uniref:BTB domain-containing protein n=2 Tax=Caenorhabditis briggsae TaxID=6238 RepID=A0AAE9DQX5_CAEBR|nr:hypothetical protein L3Y34_014490 [Caenorhabditis briggsae]
MKAIHMEQKYQEADNIVTFNHVLDFKMGPRDLRAKGSFSTVFESTILDWDLQLHKQFGGRIPNFRDSSYVISLNGTGARDLYPPVHSISFKLNVLDSEGNNFKSLKYFIDGTTLSHPRRGRIDHKSYSTEANTSFERSLSTLIAANQKKEHTMHLETRMEFKNYEFVDFKYLVGEGAPNVSDKREYYFDALTNRSRHDLKLQTSDGSQYLMTNKEIICLASSFFRQHLKEQTIEYTVGVADSLESIDICLTYLVTGRYKKPKELTPKLAAETMTLATQWKAFEHKILKNSLEKHCYEELVKNREDFMYVVNLLIVAEDAQFSNVQNCCVATINFYHFHDFVRNFVYGSHPLKDRLTRRREFMRPSLAMQVKRAFAASNEATRFIKYLPALGED